jgi:hypothetical protein
VNPSISASIPLVGGISGAADVTQLTYFIYDGSDNLPFYLRTTGNPTVFIRQNELPTLEKFDVTFNSSQSDTFFPCASASKLYYFGVLRSSYTNTPYYTLSAIKSKSFERIII